MRASTWSSRLDLRRYIHTNDSVYPIATSSMPSYLHEGQELSAESGKTYLAVSPLGQDNVWVAVDKDDDNNLVVLKAPSGHAGSWSKFLHEMIMHELFKGSDTIRKQIDRIPPSKDSISPPMLVLEILETTVWEARIKRPLSRDEIVIIIESILRALRDIHSQGLVYGDLKMENVMLSGFNPNVPSDDPKIIVKLCDLGTVMEPARGTAQPVSYRAPEVFFRENITQAADIWALGLVYSHLLEAQNNFAETGIYDDLYFGSDPGEKVRWVKHAIANDYDLWNVPYYSGCELPPRYERHDEGEHWTKLRQRGVEELDVEFLKRILKADPRQRPSAQAILESNWFAGGLLARRFPEVAGP